MSDTHNDVLIDRYLNGRMPADERAAFEARLLDEPALLEQVQTIEALKSALHHHRDLLRQPAVAPAGSRVVPLRVWMRQPLSLAATLLVAVMGWQLAHVATTPPDRLDTVAPLEPAVLAIGSVVQLENARGGEVVHFNGQAPYLFKLDAGIGNEAMVFSLTLQDARQHTLLEMGELTADAEGWVRLVVPRLADGQYEAILTWANQDGAPQTRRFPFSLGN